MSTVETRIPNKALTAELETIRRANDGVLRPGDVVEAARDEDHPLHPCFEWDDSEAAEKYRLVQARNLIKVAVMVMPKTEQTYQVYVSMRSDRAEEGGGYRRVVDVVSKQETRQQLVAEALRDLEYWQRKYAMLTELAEVFEAITKAKAKRR
jgi:hypothetical protein